MGQTFKCESCDYDVEAGNPPFPPQIQNGPMMSTVAMLNGQAQCNRCGARYVTQIQGVQISLGFMQIKEKPRIVVPSMIPPKLN